MTEIKLLQTGRNLRDVIEFTSLREQMTELAGGEIEREYYGLVSYKKSNVGYDLNIELHQLNQTDKAKKMSFSVKTDRVPDSYPKIAIT